MKEILIPVRFVKAALQCDKCKGMQVVFDGKIFASKPPKFPHTCKDCGNKKFMDMKYPTIIQIDEGIVDESV